MLDLPCTTFLALRAHFFDASGRPVPFNLRDKLNTQDDPFDEFIAADVLAKLPGISCAKAAGPLITPDMVLFQPGLCRDVDALEIASSLDRIVGIEVKKLERTAQGGVARASGLDYNTTPPCGRVRVYDAAGVPVEIRCFYLFVCLEANPTEPERLVCTALALVDGNVLNEDFDLYLSITGEREKRIGLGTYGDGADRARPMLIFGNPLGVGGLDRAATLVHPTPASELKYPDCRLVHEIERVAKDGAVRRFSCYRVSSDVPGGWKATVLRDPFPTPERETRTRPRGRFRLPFEV